MPQPIINLRSPDGFKEGIRAAVEALDRGGLVVFPTETVYGIGARADRPGALRRLHAVKERSETKPFTVHLGRRHDAERFVNTLGTTAKRLIRKGWPGPMTLVLTVSKPQETPISGSLDAAALRAIFHDETVGLRCPDDSAALEILKQVGGPVVAASANRAGQPPPGTVDGAVAALDGQFDLALDGGPARHNNASTIVRVDGDQIQLLRAGVYDERMIRGMATLNILFVCTGNTCRSPMAQGIAAKLIAERIGTTVAGLNERGIHVRSAGVAASSGMRASASAVDVLAGRGIDIASHVSQPLTFELVNQADHIFTMTKSHRADVIHLFASAEDRTATLAPDGDVHDPIGGDRSEYADSADLIERALRERIKEIEL